MVNRRYLKRLISADFIILAPRDEAFEFPKGETPEGWTRTVLPEQEWYEVRLEEPFIHTHRSNREGDPRYDW